MPSNAFRLELFGAPRVLQRGAEVRLPIRKSVALLAYLAVEGRTTRAKLAALFWGESGDEAARRNLRRELHRLREAGLADAVAVDDACVVLASGVASDVAEFDAAAQSRPDAALALYRGPLLDGFDLADAQDFNDWLAARREALARRWSQVAQSEAAQREAQGDARGALDLHTRLLAHDPLQEAPYADAMRLSYLIGDRARALELYQQLRTVLRDELGLEPLPQTAAFAEQIRTAEHLAPLVARAGSAGIARFHAPFIGRATELDTMRASDLPVVLLTGEPGIGKTRLAQQFVATMPRRVSIGCKELAREAALHVISETLRAALADDEQRSILTALPLETRQEIARLAPELADTQPPPANAALRTRFFDAVVDALSALASDGAIWFDDLHWADDTTIELLDHMAHRLARQRSDRSPKLLLVARGRELADHALANQLVVKLEREAVLQPLALHAFDDQSTLQLVRRLSGSIRGERFAQRLQKVTLGNPYFLLETIRFLFDSGELTLDERGAWITRYDDATEDYLELPVPPTVQQAVRERVERLGSAARRVMETAALAGEHFTLLEVQPATALSEWDALEGLERAMQAQLVVQVGDGYRYVHDLARSAVSSTLSPERRRLIHRQLALTLQERRGPVDRIAFHLESAGQRREAIPWRMRAAEEALRRFARTDALAHYSQAVDNGADGASAIEARLARISVRRTIGDIADSAMDLSEIDALLPEVNDDKLRYQAETARALFLLDRGQTEPGLRAIERALDLKAPSSADEVRALYLAGMAAAFLGDAVLGVRYGERARALALTLGEDTPNLHSIETGLTFAYIGCGRTHDAIAVAQQALARLDRKPASDPLFRAHLLSAYADAKLAIGELDAAISFLEEALAVADTSNAAAMKVSFEVSLVIALAKSGRAEDADRHCAALKAVIGPDPNPRFAYLQSMVAAHASIAGGRIGAALAALSQAIAIADQVGNPWYQRNARLLRARVYNDLLNHDAAVADVEAAPSLSAGLAPTVVLLRDAVLADADAAQGKCGAARDRLNGALAAERFVDDDTHESRDFLRCVLGNALIGCGERLAAIELLSRVTVTPALQARALAVRLRAGADPQVTQEADRLLESGGLAPLAQLRLLAALSATQPASAAGFDKRIHALLEQLLQDPSNRGPLDRWVASNPRA